MNIDFSKGELLEGQPITPNWYDVDIIDEKGVERKGVMDCEVEFKFVNGELAEQERKISHTFFNCLQKGKGFLVPYMAAVTQQSIKDVTDKMEKGQTINFKLATGDNVGKRIKIYIKNEPYQGRIQNRVESFLSATAEVPV